MTTSPVLLLAAHPAQDRVVVVCGNELVVLDSKSHEVIVTGDHFKNVKHTKTIRAVCFSSDGKYFASSCEDKKLKCWDASSWTLVSERNLEKRAVALDITDDNTTLVAADKHGDVWTYVRMKMSSPPVISRFPLTKKPLPTTATPSVPADSNGAARTKVLTESDGTIVVGHVSMITCAKLAPPPCPSEEKTASSPSKKMNRFLVTGDRDEKIRVSCFPDGYDIRTYCLGHTQFVSQVQFVDDGKEPKSMPYLLSAGGDDGICLWDWQAGKLLARGDLRAHVQASHGSIAVRSVAPSKGAVAIVVEGNDSVILFRYAEGKLVWESNLIVPTELGKEPLCAAFDRNGCLWVGTMKGVAFAPGFGSDLKMIPVLLPPPAHCDVFLFETLRKVVLEGEDDEGSDGETRPRKVNKRDSKMVAQHAQQ